MAENTTDSEDAQFSLYNWLGARVKRFVRWWRRFDAVVNQPLPAGRAWFWTWLAPDGYAWFASALSILLVVVMALGPTFRTAPANIALLTLGLALIVALHLGSRRKPRLNEYLLAGQLTILSLLAVVLVVLAPLETFGADSRSLRLHIGVVIVSALVTSLGFGWVTARALFHSRKKGSLSRALPSVELFAPKDRYDFMGMSPIAALVSAFLIVPVRYPVQLLLPGSLLVLFAPDRYLVPLFFAAAATLWIALFLGTLFERLMEVLNTIGRLFFIGPQFAISVLVIAVAVLRLMDVHYITYLFNAGSGGYGNTTIMGYVGLTYVAAWYYAFWSEHFVARRVIRLLDASCEEGTPLSVDYPYDGPADLSPVESARRSISLHGAGRLKIQGYYKPNYGPTGPVLQFLTSAELLTFFRSQMEQVPPGKIRRGDPLASLRNLQRSAVIYPVIASTAAFMAIGVPVAAAFLYAVQPPELTVHQGNVVALDPVRLLAGDEATGLCPSPAPGTPRVAVVASGGGTRAAIYTASVLRGLAEAGQICNVVIVSGVSGGSAALGYFALHEDELRRPGPPDRKAWDRFSDTMAQPYIEYVLDGASDMRIIFGRRTWLNEACGEPPAAAEPLIGWRLARSRLGNILAESFVCSMGVGRMKDPSFGLILNTSMLGAFDAEKKTACERTDLSLPERAARCGADLDGSVAGGRLVLTNVLFPQSKGMKIQVLDDAEMSIARAAALSANFPPVFPDAAVDVLPPHGGAGQRYWVTDGGAVENRGAMTLYLAIRAALNSVPGLPDRPPPLHIVVADVSAAAGRYRESFGFHSVLGAGGQLGLSMEEEVFSDLGASYCTSRSSVTVHEIIMPPVLRNGGIGTHWLLPESLTFREPKPGTERVTLSAADVKKIVIELHNSRDASFDDPDGASKVLGWATRDPQSEHQANWHRLIAALSRPDQGGLGGKCANRIADEAIYAQ